MDGATENSKERQDGVNTSDGVLSDLQRIASLLMNKTNGATPKMAAPNEHLCKIKRICLEEFSFIKIKNDYCEQLNAFLSKLIYNSEW